MPTNAMLLKEEKSGHEKGNLKGNMTDVPAYNEKEISMKDISFML